MNGLTMNIEVMAYNIPNSLPINIAADTTVKANGIDSVFKLNT
jgi:hypothetical protein